MKRIAKYMAPIFVVVLMVISMQLFFAGDTLYAHSPQFSLNEIELNINEGVDIIGLSTIDGESFNYTTNSTLYYSTAWSAPLLFSDFTNSNSTIESFGMTLKNGESFIYMRTLIGSTPTNNILYRVVSPNEIYELQNIYYKDDPNNVEFSFLLETTSMCYDYYDNIYLLDIINKVILTYSSTNNRLEIFKELNTFNLSSDSKICCNINGKEIYLLTNGEVYKIETANERVATKIEVSNEIPLSNISKFSCDCSGSLFFLDTTNSILHKQKNNGLYSKISLSTQVHDMFIEQNNGAIYFSNQNKIYTLNSDYFIASLIYYPEPVVFESREYLQSGSKFAVAGESCNLLASPYAITSLIQVPENSNVLLLQESLLELENFAYCFYEKDGETFLGFINKEQFKAYLSLTQEESYHKTFLKTAVYKYPTKCGEKLDVLEKETEIKVIGAFNTLDENLSKFFCIEIESVDGTKIGYIDKSYVYSSSFVDIEMINGDDTPDKHGKFIEYILILVALTMLEVVVIAFIIKKYPKHKKNSE